MEELKNSQVKDLKTVKEGGKKRFMLFFYVINLILDCIIFVATDGFFCSFVNKIFDNPKQNSNYLGLMMAGPLFSSFFTGLFLALLLVNIYQLIKERKLEPINFTLIKLIILLW